MDTSISIIYYKYKTLSNGEHPLMLRIYKNGKRKLESIGISVHPDWWDISKNCPKKGCPNKELINKIIADKIAEYNKQALEFKAEQKEFTAASLIESKQSKLQLKTIREFYTQLIKEFKETEQVGNRLIYKNSFNSLKAYTNNKLDIYFSDIDVEWLKAYEKWQRKRGNKETTISLQFRTLRSAYNKAIDAKAANQKYYPFDEYKVSKFNTKTRKRAITKEEVMKIITTETINATKLRVLTRDVFTFAYLSGGISFVDIANLTSNNIYRGRLRYSRQKTHQDINIKLREQAKEIIEKYAYHRKKATYLFPILNAQSHKTAMQKQNRIHKVLGQINGELKVLASELQNDADMTTYVARHSFASILKNYGVNVSLISEMLGHTDLKTTQIYLDSFENDQIDEAMSNLL